MAAKILSIRPGKFAVPEEMVQAGPEPSGMALAEAAPSGHGACGGGAIKSESPRWGHPRVEWPRRGSMPDSALPVQGVLTVREARPLPSGQPIRAAPQDPAARMTRHRKTRRPKFPLSGRLTLTWRLTPVTPAEPGHAGGPRPRRSGLLSARRWCADLLAPGMAGVVLHGASGIGKSVLAAQIVARVVRLEPGRLTVTFSGEVSADTLLARLASTLRRHPVAASRGGARALASAGRTDLSWGHRLELFRGHVLGAGAGPGRPGRL